MKRKTTTTTEIPQQTQNTNFQRNISWSKRQTNPYKNTKHPPKKQATKSNRHTNKNKQQKRQRKNKKTKKSKNPPKTMTSTQPKHASYMYRKSRKQQGTTNRAYPYNQELHLQATKNKPKLTLPPTAIALGRHNQNMLVICIEKAAISKGPLTEPTPTTKNFTFKPRKTSLNLRCLQLQSLWGDTTKTC